MLSFPANPFKLSTKFMSNFIDQQPKWGPLGYVTYKRTYARVIDEESGRTEEFWQTCQRVVEGVYNIQRSHCERLRLPWNAHKSQRSAQEMFTRMWEFKFLPPGRGLWMMGVPQIWKMGSAALNNCAFTSTKDISSDFASPFTFLMDMSMLGVGVGGDVKGAGLVTIKTPKMAQAEWVIPDTREGWVESVRVLLDAFVGRGSIPVFNYSKIRPYGAPIRGFGGTASGAGPLRNLHENIISVLVPNDTKITPTTVMSETERPEPLSFSIEIQEFTPYEINSTQIVDIFNYVGKCVVAGNVRRIAEIMFGSPEDKEFRSLKLNKEALEDRRWASNNSIFAEIGIDYSKFADMIKVNGEPGFMWLHNARAYGRMMEPPNWKDRRAEGANPCITGDTLIFTEEGPVRADEMLDKPFIAIVNGKKYNCKTGVFETGTKPVYLVKTKEGHSIKVTEDHKILTAPKITRKKRYELWVEAGDLDAGDKLILNDTRYNENNLISWEGDGSFNEGWLLGGLLGDGYFHKEQKSGILQYWGSTKNDMLNLAIERTKTLGGDPRYHSNRNGCNIDSKDMVSIKSRQLWEKAIDYGIDHEKNIINESTLLCTSSKFQAGFLRGFFDADGSVQGTQTKGLSVRIGLANEQHLLIIQKMLLNFGVNSTVYRNRREAGKRLLPDGKSGYKLYECNAMHELVISNDNLSHFLLQINFDEMERNDKLRLRMNDYRRTLNRERFVAEVESVTYIGIEKVYDCTIDEVHRFGANGIIVHNCSEQTLESFELCCLVETFPVNHESLEDYLATLKYAYLYAKTVTLLPTHDPRTNAVMMRNRRIGCSQSGIQNNIAKVGYRAHMEWCDSGYDRIRGLDKKYSDWLCVPRSIKMTSVKPSGTVSLLPGVSPGVHFDHSEYYIRRIRIQKDSPIIPACIEAGHQVNPCPYQPDSMVVDFPIYIENFVKSKYDASMWEQLELVAQMQRYWADNQVSATITFNETEAKQISTALSMYETRLKSISFLPLNDHGYKLAPYETISREEYLKLSSNLKDIDLSFSVHEKEDKFCDGATCTIEF